MSIVCRFVAVATVSFSSALAAQRTGPCPPVQGSVFLDCQTDQPPLSLGEAQVPTYPSILAQAGVSGSARIRYLIDTTGRVSTASYEVISASHELLASEVRRSVLGWRFAPALRGGQPVVVRREQEFVFLLPPDSASPPMPTGLLAQDTTQEGTIRTVIGRPARDSGATAYVSDQDLWSAQRVVLAELATSARSGARASSATVCATMRIGNNAVPADSETLRLLRAPGRRAVQPADCPRTYTTMVSRVDSRGRVLNAPPGWVDPYHLLVTHAEPWTRDVIFIKADVGQGTATHHYRCAVRREPAGWRANCESRSISMS